MTQSTAPERLAFSTRPASSPGPCPTSAAKHRTLAAYFSRSQGTIADVSSPPEYASTTNGPMARSLSIYAEGCINIQQPGSLSTPGHRAGEVHRFIDLLLAEWAPGDDRKQFLEALADVDARARAASATDFLTATEAQRAAILTALDAEAQAHPQGKTEAQPPFFQRMKFVTVYGYCTSEVGATAELHYEVIPGSFDGCAEPGRWRAAPGDF